MPINNTSIIFIHSATVVTGVFHRIADNIRKKGYTDIHYISYSPLKFSFTGAVLHTREKINAIIRDVTKKIIVIGYSYGGIIANNLSQFGLNIVRAIYIASPLTGNSVDDITLRKHFTGNIGMSQKSKDIININRSYPRHKYFCITFGMCKYTNDGFVKMSNAFYQKQHHIHIQWTSHLFGLVSPKVVKIVSEHLC
jgi:hypothetical protein